MTTIGNTTLHLRVANDRDNTEGIAYWYLIATMDRQGTLVVPFVDTGITLMVTRS